MKKRTIYKEIIIITLTVLPILYLLMNWSLLPDQLPIHFDLNGTPNGYGSKLVLILLPLGLYLMMLVLPFIDPRKSNYEIFSKTYYKLRVILCLFIGIFDTVVIYNTLHGIEKMGLFLPISIFMLFTLIGNYMGNIRPNYFVGIKVPWTLNNDEVWTRTHKLAGKIWFWGGLAGIVALFLVKNPMIVLLPVIIIISVVPIAYSYIIYQKINNKTIMKIRLFIILLLLLSFQNSFAQIEKTALLKTSTGDLEGTLLMPELNPSKTVALIIAGSGPTDRDGNNPMMKNNSLKMLATELNKNGIASLRYDKRGIANSKSAGLKEADMRFENNIDDVKGWVDYLKNELKFNNIVVIGHSEGSLIGMIASQDKSVNKFVSIAGAGRPADMIIREQIKNQPPFITTQVNSILDELVKGKTVENTPPELNALFRQSVQPYLISWFKYDPQKEIAKLKIPVLILQGTTDIQVSLDDANRLAKALPKAKIVVIEGMNHVMKSAPADRELNIQTYSQPDLAIKKELIDNLIPFLVRK